MRKTTERLAKLYLPPPLARLGKRLATYPRYWAQVRACRMGFERFGGLYPQQVLFVAGLPKSGTTWLMRMLCSYPGFHELLVPEATAYEMAVGRSHDYEMPEDMFSRFDEMLVVARMHVPGSPNNAKMLLESGIKYVVLYRDLRDVAVSHYFYVRQTPWHPECPTYRTLSPEEGLKVIADKTLATFVDWVQSWKQNADPELGLSVRYEDLLTDSTSTLTQIARHFELDSSPEVVREIIEDHSFTRLSGGRGRGEEETGSFFRKGIVGDWRNYFTPAVTELYKERIGQFLIENGYEKDLSW